MNFRPSSLHPSAFILSTVVDPNVIDDGAAGFDGRFGREHDDAAVVAVAADGDLGRVRLELRAEVFQLLDLGGRQLVQVLAGEEGGRGYRRRREDEGELVGAG